MEFFIFKSQQVLSRNLLYKFYCKRDSSGNPFWRRRSRRQKDWNV